MTKSDKHSSVRKAIKSVLDYRKQIADAKENLETAQPETIALMKAADPKNHGIVIDPDDSKGTAFVQQNEGSEVWDSEAIIDWLRKPVAGRKRLWSASSSRVFDPQKWEALVASKEVPPSVAKKFLKKLDPPKPFIRMGKKGKGSL